jgi:hypothetical protein
MAGGLGLAMGNMLAIESAMGPATTFASSVGGASAGGGALFSGMMGAGMGLSAMQAFGGSGSGTAPTFAIPLSPGGKKLEKTLYETTKKQYQQGLMPANLASIYVGKIKRQEGRTRRQTRGFLTSMAGGVRSGRDVRALLTEGNRRLGSSTNVARWRMGQKEEEFRNALAMMENIRNIEKQTPLLRAQASMYKNLQGAGRRAAQGQALGDIAQMAMLYKAYG